jgi:hypothetical protein
MSTSRLRRGIERRRQCFRAADGGEREWGVCAGGGVGADHAAGYADGCGRGKWVDDGAGELCGDGYVHEYGGDSGGGFARCRAQQHERSVKEFGAVCDGVTDDTAALQAAINFAQNAVCGGTWVSLTLPAGVCKTHQLSGIWSRLAGKGGRFRR